MIAVDVTMADAAWGAVWPDAAAAARHTLEIAARQVLTEGPAVEVSVVLLDDEGVRLLNRDYRGQDKATNVLSFPALDPQDARAAQTGARPRGWPPSEAVVLGDIVLARQTVAAEAAAQGKTLTDHARHLLVHGFLHLLSYDHDDDAAAAAMEGLEITILSTLGVANPYAPERHASDFGARL